MINRICVAGDGQWEGAWHSLADSDDVMLNQIEVSRKAVELREVRSVPCFYPESSICL